MPTRTGRWEFRDASSDKFWQLSFEPVSGSYLTEWGRNGKPAQAMKGGLSEAEARKKIREKESKGYRFVGGAQENTGTRAGRATVAAAAKAVEAAAPPTLGQRRIWRD